MAKYENSRAPQAGTIANPQADTQKSQDSLQKFLSRESLREHKEHGKKSFPFAMYHGRIPEWLSGYPIHWHKEFEIIFLTYGSGIINVQGKKFVCQKDDIVIIPPHQVHSIARNGTEKMAYYNILFDFSFLEENPSSFCSMSFFEKFSENTVLKEPHAKSGSELNKKLLPLLQSLVDFYNENYEEYALLIKARLFEAMHLLKNQVVAVKETKAAHEKRARLKKIISFIQENYSRPISVEEVACLSNLSPNRFMKMFKEETDMPFIQYLNDYRLELAAEAILEGKKSVTQIAFETGFENLSYFISLFHRKFGLTPKEYRASKL